MVYLLKQITDSGITLMATFDKAELARLLAC